MWSLTWSCKPGDSLGEVSVTAAAEGLTTVESRARSTLFPQGFCRKTEKLCSGDPGTVQLSPSLPSSPTSPLRSLLRSTAGPPGRAVSHSPVQGTGI